MMRALRNLLHAAALAAAASVLAATFAASAVAFGTGFPLVLAMIMGKV
jgi:hypothetical protein